MSTRLHIMVRIIVKISIFAADLLHVLVSDLHLLSAMMCFRVSSVVGSFLVFPKTAAMKGSHSRFMHINEKCETHKK